jgi:hypothetical protein
MKRNEHCRAIYKSEVDIRIAPVIVISQLWTFCVEWTDENTSHRSIRFYLALFVGLEKGTVFFFGNLHYSVQELIVEYSD